MEGNPQFSDSERPGGVASVPVFVTPDADADAEAGMVEVLDLEIIDAEPEG
jgi:hypothetical protein